MRKVNSMLLNNLWVEKEIKEETTKYVDIIEGWKGLQTPGGNGNW